MTFSILDTAGRLRIDDQLMDELVRIKRAVGVDETLLVVDAMAGQETVNVAKTFNEKVGISGVIWPDRRHPQRCGTLGAGRHRHADLLPGHGREAQDLEAVSTRRGWRTASLAWAMCFP